MTDGLAISLEIGTRDRSFLPELFETDRVESGTTVAAGGASIRAGRFRLMEAAEAPVIVELIIQEAPGALTKIGLVSLAPWLWGKIHSTGRVWINGRTIESEQDVLEVLRGAQGEMEGTAE